MTDTATRAVSTVYGPPAPVDDPLSALSPAERAALDSVPSDEGIGFGADRYSSAHNPTPNPDLDNFDPMGAQAYGPDIEGDQGGNNFGGPQGAQDATNDGGAAGLGDVDGALSGGFGSFGGAAGAGIGDNGFSGSPEGGHGAPGARDAADATDPNGDHSGSDHAGLGGTDFGGTDYGGYGGGNSDFGGGGDGFGGDGGGYGGAPIILDLTGQGLKITPRSSSNVVFDMAGDGYKHRTAWAGAGNGVLATRRVWVGTRRRKARGANGDSQISERNEILFKDWDPTASGDLQALRNVFDSNQNGMLDAGDARKKVGGENCSLSQ
jgi:hypothetical protein